MYFKLVLLNLNIKIKNYLEIGIRKKIYKHLYANSLTLFDFI